MREIIINKRKIGLNEPIFLIAEVGVNHNGDLGLAKNLIDVATIAKVDAVKFQTFITDKVFADSTPKVNYQKDSKEDQETFNEMVKKYEFSKDNFKELKDYCEKQNIIFLSTPYDEISVEWLDELNIGAFKVSSGDLNNFQLLKLICSKKKPIFLSTGMATLKEVKESLNFLNENGAKEIIIFQCTTNYPSAYEELNLNVIDTYKKEFINHIIGFSDHSLGTLASVGAAAKGVKVIEKHITLDKGMEGPDHKASLDPNELKQWVEDIRIIEKALGSFEKQPSESEKEIAKIARRSIFSNKNLIIGEILKITDIIVKRPGTGISPNFFYKILGKKINKNIPKDKEINWQDIE